MSKRQRSYAIAIPHAWCLVDDLPRHCAAAHAYGAIYPQQVNVSHVNRGTALQGNSDHYKRQKELSQLLTFVKFAVAQRLQMAPPVRVTVKDRLRVGGAVFAEADKKCRGL
jgi:hypothetical protein